MEAISTTKLQKLIPLINNTTYNIEECPRIKSLARAMLKMNFQKHVFMIHNEYGYLCLAVGNDIGDALDNAVDNDCLDSCLINEDELDEKEREQIEENYVHLGNASELFDLTYINAIKIKA